MKVFVFCINLLSSSQRLRTAVVASLVVDTFPFPTYLIYPPPFPSPLSDRSLYNRPFKSPTCFFLNLLHFQFHLYFHPPFKISSQVQTFEHIFSLLIWFYKKRSYGQVQNHCQVNILHNGSHMMHVSFFSISTIIIQNQNEEFRLCHT